LWKGKAKGKSAHMSTITYGELSQIVNFREYWDTLQEEMEALKTHFVQQLSVR